MAARADLYAVASPCNVWTQFGAKCFVLLSPISGMTVYKLRANLKLSILLANTCSLDSKIDYLKKDVKDCHAPIFTETWLNDGIPDSETRQQSVHLHQQ